MHEIVHVVLFLDNVLGQDFASSCAEIVQIGIPELEQSLSSEPMLAYQQTVDDTGAVVLIGAGDLAGGLGSLDDGGGDDIAVGSGDAIFGQFAGNDLFELVFQAEGSECDLLGGNGRGDFSFAVSREQPRQFVV